jgi:hypothetical protein
MFPVGGLTKAWNPLKPLSIVASEKKVKSINQIIYHNVAAPAAGMFQRNLHARYS